MSKTFSPMGIQPIMNTLDGNVLRLLLKEHGLANSANNAGEAYKAYLENAQEDNWYKLCTRLYDIDLVSYYNQHEGARLLTQINEADLRDQFNNDLELPGDPVVHSIIAWMSNKFKSAWNDLTQDAYNNQIASGGKKHYIGDRIGKPPSDATKKKMKADFEQKLADYLTRVRSKVENVHVEDNPAPPDVRYIVYFDPFPKNQSEFENKELTQKPNKAVEHLSILFKQNEKHPFITIRSEDLTTEQDADVAKLFINEFLGFEEGSKPTEKYNLEPFNQFSKVELDRSDIDLADYRFTQLKIRTTHNDGTVEENTHKYTDGDVYECCRPYYIAKNIPLEKRKLLEMRMSVSVFIGPPPPMQPGIFGGELPTRDRPVETYDVIISGGSRNIVQCNDPDTKKSIERILDGWGLCDLNDIEAITSKKE